MEHMYFQAQLFINISNFFEIPNIYILINLCLGTSLESRSAQQGLIKACRIAWTSSTKMLVLSALRSKWGIPWTGYLVPARDGSGLLPDWESSWDAAAAVTWKFRLTFWPGNYIWSFQIGFWLIWELSEFWYRGSTQKFEPDWSSRVVWPGEPF